MKTNWALTAFDIKNTNGQTLRALVKGRDLWALQCLMAAGPKGCTPINTPGPRWSAYAFNLRTAGIEIETITEKHTGDFPGHHARYVLRSTVTRPCMAAQGVAA